MILLGVGGAALGGGGVAVVLNSATYDELMALREAPPELVGDSDKYNKWLSFDPEKDASYCCGDVPPFERAEYLALEADNQLFTTLQGVLLGVGAAAAATGLVLVLIDDGGDDAPAASLQLSPTEGGACGQATFRF